MKSRTITKIRAMINRGILENNTDDDNKAKINPIWQPGDPPDSIFTREDVRAMMEVAAQNAKVVQIGLRDRILKEFEKDVLLDAIRKERAIKTLSKVLDKLNIK